MTKNTAKGVISDLKDLRHRHQKKVFSLLCNKDYTCRELSDELGLSNVVLYRVLDDFIENDLVVSYTPAQDVIGRKPTYYSLNNDYGYFAVFDFTLPLIRFGVYNLRKQPFILKDYQQNTPLDIRRIEEIASDALNLIKKRGLEDKIKSVGISVSGRINPKTDYFSVSATFVNAKEINMKNVFGKFFNCPIHVKNNVALAFRSALNAYSADDIQNCIYLYINKNIGGAVLINGKFWNGCNNFSGEIASTMDDKGNLMYADFFDISKKYADACAKKGLPLNASDTNEILSLYEKNDPCAEEAVNEKLLSLAALINNYLLMLDCDNIILNCIYTEKSEKARNKLLDYLKSLIAYFSAPNVIFTDSDDTVFLDGCLNYVITKSTMHTLKYNAGKTNV